MREHEALQFRYRAFDLTIASTLPFTCHAVREEENDEVSTDLQITVAAAPPRLAATTTGQVLWESPGGVGRGRSGTLLERCGPWWALRFGGIGDFFVDENRIVVVPLLDSDTELLQLRLLGPVLAFCLELRGIVTLHASAVVVDGRAVGLLASHGGGKTTLAAALLEQGARLLTDDLLALEVRSDSVHVLASFPQMRMWPAAAEQFTGSSRRFAKVHPDVDKRRIGIGESGFGRFQAVSAPLAAIHLAERRSDLDEIQVERLAPARSLLALLAGSYLPRLAPAAGLLERRLDVLSRVVGLVPIQRLVYPQGYDRLVEAVRVIEQDIVRRR